MSHDSREAAKPTDESPKGDGPLRIDLAPYRGPRSHHASRAFAEMQERKARQKRLRLIAIVVLVVGGGALLVHGATRWLGAP